MNLVDLLIILMALGALTRGYRIGMTRQAGSTLGFIGGLFVGSWLSALFITHLSSTTGKTLTSLLFVLCGGLIGTTIGEVVGLQLKTKLMRRQSLDTFDGGLGSVMAATTMLFAIWLGASILVLGPSNGFQQILKSSRILSSLDSHLPPATSLLSSLNKLVDPNGFPEVFSGLEPSPGSTNVPSLGSLTPAVQAAQASVVKVEGTGCGGIVEGSGFVLAKDRIVTNAHVVAGVASPKVIDGNGLHNTRVVWFDANVDLAVLEVRGLAGKPLRINSSEQPSGTPAVALGYPGGGNFTAQPAAVIDHFTAYGRNIYGQSTSVRDIYSLKAHIIPGNSGGPLVASDGQVLGIVFATSTTYNDVGYALTGHQVASELASAAHSTTTYSTGSCSE